MPTLSELEQVRTKANQLTGVAGEYSAGANNVESLLKQKLTEAYKANEDIVKPLDVATANYYSAPSVAREKYQDIFNPFTREKLVSQYTGVESLPMLSYSNLYGQRQGSIADTLKAGTGAYAAEAEAATNQAKVAQNTYDQMWNEYKFQEEQALAREKMNTAEDPFTKYLKTMTTLRGFEPAQGLITAGQNADDVLRNINNVKNASKEDLAVAAKIASGVGISGLPGLVSTFKKWGATPTQQQLAQDLVNTRNVLRLRYTGAAFSESERPDYAFLTGNDPVLAFADPEFTRKSLTNLEPTFQKISKSGKNPYEDLINNLNQMYMGGGGSSSSILVQDLATGQIGTLDSEDEFDPTKYKRLSGGGP